MDHHTTQEIGSLKDATLVSMLRKAQSAMLKLKLDATQKKAKKKFALCFRSFGKAAIQVAPPELLGDENGEDVPEDDLMDEEIYIAKTDSDSEFPLLSSGLIAFADSWNIVIKKTKDAMDELAEQVCQAPTHLKVIPVQR